MLQLCEINGAVILTFSDSLTPKEREILSKAREVESKQKNKVVGAGGICWGDCATKKDDYWDKQKQNVSSQAAESDEMDDALFSEFEEIYNPFDENVPF